MKSKAYHGGRFYSVIHLLQKRILFFLILSKSDVFFRNDNSLHLDLGELLVVDVKVVNNLVM